MLPFDSIIHYNWHIAIKMLALLKITRDPTSTESGWVILQACPFCWPITSFHLLLKSTQNLQSEFVRFFIDWIWIRLAVHLVIWIPGLNTRFCIKGLFFPGILFNFSCFISWMKAAIWMLILPIKEKERSENDEIDAPEIDLRISGGIKGKSANVRPEGRRRVSYFQVNFASHFSCSRTTREFLE